MLACRKTHLKPLSLLRTDPQLLPLCSSKKHWPLARHCLCQGEQGGVMGGGGFSCIGAGGRNSVVKGRVVETAD